MQASPTKLLRLLGDNETVFKVPVYQRKYEWNKEQLEQYFLDINRILDSDYKKEHFLGTVVYVQNELSDLMKERLLIDGQQRITTTFILLKAIMDLIKENDKENVVWQKIRDTYLINPYGKEDTKYKLVPVDIDKLAYNELMVDNLTDSRIYENYKLCREYILESEYGIEEIYKALGNINIVYISLDDKENPQVIFESLNSTGLSLTQSDLIRNFILMGLNYEEQTELYKNYWKKIESILPNKLISEFVRDYLTMKEDVVPKQNKVYEAFKSYYYSYKYDSKDVLEELLKYTYYYSMIINSTTEYEEINIQLNYINTIRNTVSYPYLLKLFNDFYDKELIDENEFLNVLEIIVSYIYRRNICNIATNALNKIFSSMSKEVDVRIEEGLNYVDSVIDYLMSRSGTGIFPRDEEFKQNFINNDLYNKSNSLSKVLLHTIEKNIHKEVVDVDKLTVEHILPQTLTDEWNIELGKNAHEIYRLYRNSVGNLTLTNYNSEISNRSFDEKKDYYKNSNIRITRDIYKYDNWSEKQILDRAEYLFNIIKTIWELPNDKYENITEDRLLPHEEYSIKDNVLVTGHSPKMIIIDNEKILVKSWREMLTKTCSYLYDFDQELFESLKNNKRFSRLISDKNNNFKREQNIKDDVYIETNYSAKDILSYVVLLSEEYGIADLIYFEIR